MNHTVDCSICIANYNGMGVIDDCIQSVLMQHGDINYEIIVHDDASSDESADYIASHYPQVVLIRSDKNVGYCISNNRMASRANGKFLLFLNNDAALYPDALQTLLEFVIQHSNPAILTLPQYEFIGGQLIDRGLFLDPFLNPVPNLDIAHNEVATVHGACLWVPRDLWNSIGGFPEWFHMVAEDLYVCCAARLRGAKVLVTPESGYRHRIGYSLGGGKPQGARLHTTHRRRALSERNKNFVMVICYPLSILLFLLPVHAVFLLLEGLLLSAIHFNPTLFTQIYLASLWALWKEHHNLCAFRRSARRNNKITVTRFFSTFMFLPQKLRLLLRHGVPRIHA